jgi:hypothetical protein
MTAGPRRSWPIVELLVNPKRVLETQTSRRLSLLPKSRLSCGAKMGRQMFIHSIMFDNSIHTLNTLRRGHWRDLSGESLPRAHESLEMRVKLFGENRRVATEDILLVSAVGDLDNPLDVDLGVQSSQRLFHALH